MYVRRGQHVYDRSLLVVNKFRDSKLLEFASSVVCRAEVAIVTTLSVHASCASSPRSEQSSEWRKMRERRGAPAWNRRASAASTTQWQPVAAALASDGRLRQSTRLPADPYVNVQRPTFQPGWLVRPPARRYRDGVDSCALWAAVRTDLKIDGKTVSTARRSGKLRPPPLGRCEPRRCHRCHCHGNGWLAVWRAAAAAATACHPSRRPPTLRRTDRLHGYVLLLAASHLTSTTFHAPLHLRHRRNRFSAALGSLDTADLKYHQRQNSISSAAG